MNCEDALWLHNHSVLCTVFFLVPGKRTRMTLLAENGLARQSAGQPASLRPLIGWRGQVSTSARPSLNDAIGARLPLPCFGHASHARKTASISILQYSNSQWLMYSYYSYFPEKTDAAMRTMPRPATTSPSSTAFHRANS